MIMQVEIKDNEYKSWVWRDNATQIETNMNLNPLELKLFNGDLVEEDGKLIKSNYRNTERTIPGILVLDCKTYGRSPNGKPLYKCIPDNKQLPIFLVPYEERNPSFNKNRGNNYVLFKFKEWKDKHPIGILINTFGHVQDIKAFEEYQLSCKELNVSLQKFTKETIKKLNEYGIKENMNDAIIKKYTIEDRRIGGYNVFSIDPLGSKDFDDAFSIQKYEKYIIISIYIANVPLIIDYLNLWNEFTSKVSTIYLPSNKKSMLPPVLSDDLCSLQEGKERFAFTMDLKILKNDVVENNKELSKIVDIRFSNTLIKLTKNYVYEEPELLSFPNYVILFEYTRHLQKKLQYLDDIKDSHDVVAYYMIMMNYESSKKMIEYNVGIFRATSLAKSTEENIEPPSEIMNFIKGWKYEMSGYYCDNVERKGHELIANGLTSYTHITSPIRRIVDLINLIELQREFGLFSSSTATLFAKNWLYKIDYINKSSKSIKKVQQNCLLLHTLMNVTQKDVIYKGYVLEKNIVYKNINNLIKYNVYIPSLNMVSSFKTENDNIQLYKECEFILRIIIDEDNLRKKIRLQII